MLWAVPAVLGRAGSLLLPWTRPAPTSAALTLLLERVGVGWGDWEGAVPEAAEGHPPHPCSPRGRQGWRGSWGALLYLQIVEDEEERLSGQALIELHGV